MANWYVRSTSSGAGDGTTWADAYTTLAAAFAAKSAGDTFWVSDNHSESTAGALTLTSPGTAASLCYVLCVNDSAEPPTALATTAVIANTTSAQMHVDGYTVYYGITFSCSDGASANGYFYTAFDNAASTLLFEDCVIKLNSTHASMRVTFGREAAATAHGVILKNTSFYFSASGQSVWIACPTYWQDSTALAGGSTAPTSLITVSSQKTGDIHCRNVDFSGLGSNNLVDAKSNAFRLRAVTCKLGASMVPITGTILNQHAIELSLVNCDSGDTNYRYHKQNYQGTITQETTIVKTGGASDGTTTVSRKMVTTANSKFEAPLVSDPVTVWNESTSSITLKIPVVTDNVTLDDDEAWIEVDYLGTSGFPLGLMIDDRMADVMATPAAQTTDSTSTWTTTGLSTPVKQELGVTFTPAEKGPINVRVCLAKASSTMYFCPLAMLT